MVIKWRNKIEGCITVAGFVAGVIGLIYFGVYAYRQVNARSAEMLELLARIF